MEMGNAAKTHDVLIDDRGARNNFFIKLGA
jgi:hypothetical protein